MTERRFVCLAALCLLGASCKPAPSASTLGQPSDGDTLVLPEPTPSATPVLRALAKRHTSRDYATQRLPPDVVANLLWAADGVNRPETGGRTAPSAHDWRYMDILVFDSSGVYRYDPPTHGVERLFTRDLRAITGYQELAAIAPLSLVYVADEAKMQTKSADEIRLFGDASAGTIAQNVYLFAAESGLNTGVRADIDRRQLHAALGLASSQRIVLAQSVGYAPSGDAAPPLQH